MEGGGFERLVPLLIFGAVVAFNQFWPRLQRWLKEQQAAAVEAARKQQRPGKTPVPAPVAKRQDDAAARRAAQKVAQKAAQKAVQAERSGDTALRRAARLPVDDAADLPRAPPLPRHALPPEPRPRRNATRALLSTPEGLRQALVLAAVMGPCRADKPYDAPE